MQFKGEGRMLLVYHKARNFRGSSACPSAFEENKQSGTAHPSKSKGHIAGKPYEDMETLRSWIWPKDCWLLKLDNVCTHYLNPLNSARYVYNSDQTHLLSAYCMT